MAGYTKLFNSILASTIWREPNHVRIVWITLLAMADKNGVADGSVPGLADFARVSIDDCRDALARLSDPDRDSRSQEHDGRRIQAVDGGWLLLNHAKYRAKLNADERREYNRIKQAESRERKSSTVKSVNDESALSAHTEAEADTEAVRAPPLGSLLEPSTLDAETQAALATLLRHLPESSWLTAKTLHDAIEHDMRAAGWTVEREVKIDDRGDGRSGYLDLIVTSPVRLALELDREQPRVKSLEKLRIASLSGYAGVVICRVRSGTWRREGPIAVYGAAATGQKMTAEEERMAKRRAFQMRQYQQEPK